MIVFDLILHRNPRRIGRVTVSPTTSLDRISQKDFSNLQRLRFALLEL